MCFCCMFFRCTCKFVLQHACFHFHVPFHTIPAYTNLLVNQRHSTENKRTSIGNKHTHICRHLIEIESHNWCFFLLNDFNVCLLFLCLVQLPNLKRCPAGGMCTFDGLRPFAAWRGAEGADDPMARGTCRRNSS